MVSDKGISSIINIPYLLTLLNYFRAQKPNMNPNSNTRKSNYTLPNFITTQNMKYQGIIGTQFALTKLLLAPTLHFLLPNAAHPYPHLSQSLLNEISTKPTSMKLSHADPGKYLFLLHLPDNSNVFLKGILWFKFYCLYNASIIPFLFTLP